MDHVSNDQMEMALGLIEKIGEILCAEEEEEKKSGRRFNVFNALGLERKELYHSRFLACLLDPRGIHGQKGLFLRSFLRDVLGDEAEKSSLEKSEVVTEANIQNGRLDIQVILPDGQTIIIENKIDAGEGKAQLECYGNHLRDLPQFNSGKPHHLVFLTPEGRLPSSCSSSDVKCISYERITGWLDKLRSEVPDSLRLRFVIDQYVDLWRGIPMNDKFRNLLHDPKNLEIAEHISMAVEQVKKEVKAQFLNQVQQYFKSRLQEMHLDADWDVLRTRTIDIYAGCGLLWRGRKQDLRNQAISSQQFTVLFEAQDNNWDTLIVGICRGAKVPEDKQHPEDKEISRKMRSDQKLRQSEWWPGYGRLQDLVGRRTVSVKDFVIEEQQLAKLVTDKLWRLFETYREDLEKLNCNYPYTPYVRFYKDL